MEGNSRTRVAVYGTMNLLAEGLKKILSEAAEVEVVGVAIEPGELKSLFGLSPDLLLTDDPLCCHLIPESVRGTQLKILLLTDGEPDLPADDDLHNLMGKGLAGIMPRETTVPMLLKAIQKIEEGEVWIDHKTISRLLSSKSGASMGRVRLTGKETEVLQHICHGDTNRAIARKLNISEQTVKSHCNQLFKKFGVTNRVKLVLSAGRMVPECRRPSTVNESRIN